MKKYIFFIVLFILSFVILSIVFGFLGKNYIKNEKNNHEINIEIPDSKIITLFHNGKVEEIKLEKYLVGVVAAEMPGNFEIEALKAQAVAARTYTLRKEKYGNDKHNDAIVCSDYTHCKAYVSDEEIKGKGEEWVRDFLPKITKAVIDTNGEIITYDNEPISAVFFSTSSGMTENASDVWGGEVPYLVSVKSEGDDESPRFTDEISFTYEEFKDKIKSSAEKVEFSDTPTEWIKEIIRNDTNSVSKINICGTLIKGTDIRTLLGIRSTNFEIEVTDKITVKTKGFGHGVGMSQYGANYMAKMGYDYKDILKKYYTGVDISQN